MDSPNRGLEILFRNLARLWSIYIPMASSSKTYLVKEYS